MYTIDVRNKCINLCKSGLSFKKVHELTGVSVRQLQGWCDYKTATPRTRRSTAEKQRCLDLYASGLGSYEVAELTGIDASVVWRWADKAGIGRSRKEARRAGMTVPKLKAAIREALDAGDLDKIRELIK